MNAVEIEEAISALAERPFDSVEFPFSFLQAFGNKETTIKRLRAGASNKSDIGGVLQTNNIHLAVAAPSMVTLTLSALRSSPATARAKAKFVLATDGDTFEAEDLETGETVACNYADFPDHFGFFLPLAGITTVREISDNAFDIRATSRLNRLYVELLKDNPEWGTAERRYAMNHLMARLIFCFFAEDTGIFREGQFTATIAQMSQITTTIAAAVEEQGAATQEIARNIQSVAAGSNEVSKHIGGVSAAAEATGQAAGAVLTNAKELDGQSGILRKAVDDFLAKVRAA